MGGHTIPPGAGSNGKPKSEPIAPLGRGEGNGLQDLPRTGLITRVEERAAQANNGPRTTHGHAALR